MSSLTSRLGLYKPDDTGSENINVTTDLNNNLDALDAKIGVFPCTSGTRPSSPYDGQMIFETDTERGYVWTTHEATWRQFVIGDTTFLASLAANGFNSTGPVDVRAGAALNNIFTVGVTGGGTATFFVTGGGAHKWGPGGTPDDTNLYRLGVAQLKTDGDLFIGDALDVQNGADIGADLLVGGDLVLNGARQRSRLSNAVTVANTVTETMLAEQTIPAGDMVVGAVYRVKAWGTCAVTGTPTLTFRGKVGATTIVSFPAITARSGMTDGCWRIEYLLACTTAGVGGAVVAMLEAQHNFLTSATTYTPIGPQTASPVSRDTTLAADMEITIQWSAASTSNTIACRGFFAERIA